MIHVLYVVNLYVECYVTTESNPTREDLCSAQIPYVSLYKNARRCCKGNYSPRALQTFNSLNSSL